MTRIENDRFLYEVEFGSYSYFEDKETGECRYLPHSSRIMQNQLVVECLLTKIDIVNSILKHTDKATYWTNEARADNYKNVIRFFQDAAVARQSS